MKINIMLMTFIMIGFIGFKFLFLQGTTIATEECDFGSPITYTNCFITITVNECVEGIYDKDNNTVCINVEDIGNVGDCSIGGIDFLDDIADCLKYIGDVVFGLLKLVWAVALSILAIVGNFIILVALYVALGLTPIPNAPFIINFLMITPFAIGNILVIVSFIPGE